MAGSGQGIGVGPTPQLSLRVSVATLTRVVFPRPEDGVLMLALEHKATLVANGEESEVIVKAQPFGGAVRLMDPASLNELANGFHYDSRRAQAEEDFRVYVRPAAWRAVLDFCRQNLGEETKGGIECDPTRELVEEFEDALAVTLTPAQYTIRPLRTVVEPVPAPTANIHAAGSSSVRIYKIYQAEITEGWLCRAMMEKSASHSPAELRRLALADAAKGGHGRANAVLAAPMAEMRAAFLRVSPEQRGQPQPFMGTYLAGNAAALLEDLPVSKYRNIDDLGIGEIR